MAESDKIVELASESGEASSPAPPVTEEAPKEDSGAGVSGKGEESKIVEEGKYTEEKKVAEYVEAPEEKTVEAVEASLESKLGEGAEEKTVEAVEATEGATEREVPAPLISEEQPLPSFKEETYRVGDLKETEKKALQDLKLKIEASIKARAFLKPSKSQTSREVEVLKPADDTEVAEKKIETEVKEGETGAEETIVTATAVVEETTTTAEAPATATSEEPIVATAPKEEGSPATELTEEVAAVIVKEEVPAATVPLEPPAASELISKEEEAAATETIEPATEKAGDAAGEEVVLEQTTREVAIEEQAPPPPPAEDLSMWGIPLLHTKGDDRTDVILLKFLRARDFKVNDAFDMLKNTVLWRKKFQADSLIEEDFGTSYEGVAYMQGCDKEGHPVCYNYYGLFQNKELYQKTMGDVANFEKFLRWRIQILEKGIQQLNFSPGGVSSMLQITDFKDSPGFMKWVQMTKKALELLQDNYPELVAKQVFLNVPWYFGALYSIYGRVFTYRQKSKVVIVRPGKVTETLFKYISPEHVPLKYGGLNRPNDTEFEGPDAPVTEVVVKAGERRAIELPVLEPETTVVWDLTVTEWELVYGEEFVPSSATGYTVIIQKTKKMPSSAEPVRNSFRASEPGKIVLTIDNHVSRRKKVAAYRYATKKAIPATDY